MLIILDIGQTFSYFGQLYMAIKGSQNEKSSLVYIIIVDYIWKMYIKYVMLTLFILSLAQGLFETV